MSFRHYLLPFHEQDAHHLGLRGPTFNLQNPWALGWNVPTMVANGWPSNLVGVVIPTLLCPSDSGYRTSTNINFFVSYIGIYSGYNDGENVNQSNPAARAVFRPTSGTRLAEITDGTSNTLAISEALRPVSEKYATHQDMATTQRAGSAYFYLTLGPNSPSPDVLCACDGGCAYGSPTPDRVCVGSAGDTNGYASPRSAHVGGVQGVQCDGSIKFFKNSITLGAWRAYGSIAGGETKTGDN